MSDITIKNINSFLNNENRVLSEKEEAKLNSIFTFADTEDADGNYLGRGKGDGSLNNNEWSLFVERLKVRGKSLYEQLTNFVKSTNDTIQYDYLAKNKVINQNMYQKDYLKKQFPEDKYDIKSYEEDDNNLSTEVIDKSTKEIILKYEYLDNGYTRQSTITANNSKLIYTDATLREEEDLQDGTLTTYEYNGGHVQKDITRGNSVHIKYIDDELTYKYSDNKEYEHYNDGSYRTFDAETGIETYYDNKGEVKEQKNKFNENFYWIASHMDSKEDLIDLLNNKVNSQNALQIMSNTRNYNNIHNMLAELCDNEEEAKQEELKLFQKCIEQAEDMGVYSKDLKYKTNGYDLATLSARCESEKGDLKDEPITKDTKIEQGLVGNCWLVEKIAAMTQTDDGLEILNNMYVPQKNSDGSLKSIIVNVQGEKYDIPIEEVYGANELSNGNLYVRAIEIGVRKYLEQRGVENTYGVQDQSFMFDGTGGGNSSMGSEILVGNGIEITKKGSIDVVVDKTKNIDENFMQEIKNTSNAIIGVSTSKSGFKAYILETGETENITPYHAYSVVNIDNESIYLIEPSNNKKTLKMSYKEFENCFEKGDITPIQQMPEEDEKTIVESGSIFVQFIDKDYLQMLNNPGLREQMYEQQEQKIKTDLLERFDNSKYNVDVTYNGRYFEYNIERK